LTLPPSKKIILKNIRSLVARRNFVKGFYLKQLLQRGAEPEEWKKKPECVQE
jgi:hypothetical protein